MPSSSKSHHTQTSHGKSKRSHGDDRSRKYKYDYYDGNGKRRHRDRDYRESKRRRRHRSSSASSYSSRSSNESYHAYHKRRGGGNSRRSDKYESKHNGKPDPMLNLTPAERKKMEENKKLELEMKRRKERIEKWRTERKKQLGYTDEDGNKKGKKWSLEDDDEEDDNDNMIHESENQMSDEPVKVEIITQSDPAINKAEGEELDPLDAYMMDIKEEVKKIKQADKIKMSKVPANVPITYEPEPEDECVPQTQAKPVKAPNLSSSPGPTFPPIVKPAPAAPSVSSKNARGELMEQGQDLLEYSSEEEDELAIEDLAKIMSASHTNQSKMDKFITSMDKTYFEYEPFRKEFYKEVPEIANMTATEVAECRKKLEDIEIHGKNCPKPIKTWAQAGFSRKILDILKKNNFETPTPIQAQALPAIMSGRDVIGIAKTGSGKTLAFILPMFRQILDQPPLADAEGPIGLIMTPTRELALQIFKDCRKFAKYLDLRVACVYGGAGISEQIAELKRGAEIVVATPGRMIDMLAANNGKVTNLKRITYCVLDEADRMFDMGFEPQVMRIIENIRPDRQTVLFSATFPRQMEALARRILKKPIEILVGTRSTVANTVEQHIFVLEGDDRKYLKLLEILGHFYGSEEDSSSIIVFVEKQERADELLKDLMTSSYSCLALHGGLDQHDRDSTISDFKAGNVKILIATSVAARGLDVKNLDLVVNFDCPNHYEDYVHRCGRTGRAGKKGFAYTFLTPDQGKMAGEILKALELSKAKNVSPDLKKLWEKYKVERKVEGKEIKAIGPGGGGGGGYGGRGYKFSRVEENLLSEIKKKIQKSVSGFKDSDDEEDDHSMAPDIDQRIDKIFKGEAGVSMQNPTDACVQGAQPDPSSALATTAQLDQARAAASKIAFLGNPIKPTPGSGLPASLLVNPLAAGALAGPDFMQRSTEAFLKGQSLTTSGTIENQRKNMAELLAEKLNAKLNYLPTDGQLYGGGDTGGLRITGSSLDLIANIPHLSKYDDEIEINEFPQQVRWRITSKDTVNYICEYADVGITVKGQYYPPGRNPKLGEDRKLYLALESSTQYGIQAARAEIKRVIKEEMQKMQTYAPNLARGGRYKLF